MDQQTFQESLKELRQNDSNQGLWLVALFTLLLLSAFVAYGQLSWMHWIWLMPVMGWIQYYVVISGHEAVHKTLCPNQRLNELVGVVGQAMVGVNFTAYRLQHMDHHRAPTYETDPDAHIYMGVLKQRPGLPRLLWLTLGTIVEILIKIRQKGIEGYGTERQIKPEIQRNMRRDSLLVICMQLGIMSIGWWLLSQNGLFFDVWNLVGLTKSATLWWALFSLGVELVLAYAIVWTIPLFFVTVFLNRCRIVIEHGLALTMAEDNPEFAGLRIPTVEVVPTRLERWVFAPFCFNYHCSHHAFMAIPHYKLAELNDLMRTQNKEKQNKLGFLQIEGGYLQALWKIIQHPRVWE